MACSSSAFATPKVKASIEGIYQKQLTLYDENRRPHPPRTSGQVQLQRTELVDTLRTEFACPICLGLLNRTMVTECLHRFCSECIQKAIYKGNKECPSCRKKLVSRRNLRADSNMDMLINAIWPDRAQHEAMQAEQAQQQWQQRTLGQGQQQHLAEALTSTEIGGGGAKFSNNITPAAQPRRRGRPRKIIATATTNEVAVVRNIPSWGLEEEEADETAEERKEATGNIENDDNSNSQNSKNSDSTYYSCSSSFSAEYIETSGRNLVVPVDPKLVSVKDDDFERENEDEKGKKDEESPPAKKPKPESAAQKTPNVEEESSGVWSGGSTSSSSASTPQPNTVADYLPLASEPQNKKSKKEHNEKKNNNNEFSFPAIPRPIPAPLLAHQMCMERAFRLYVDNTCPLGIITVQLKPLAAGEGPSAATQLLKFRQNATVAHLHHTSGMGRWAMRPDYFVRMAIGDRLVRLQLSDHVFTVLALAKRTRFFDYPTVFYETRKI